jgi:FkbH-like protein
MQVGVPKFNALKKLSKKTLLNDAKTIKVAILGDFASQLFRIAIEGIGVEKGFRFEIYEADFDQIDFQILNPQSDLYVFQPDWVVILQNNVTIKDKFYKSDDSINFGASFVSKIQQYYDLIQSKLDAKCIINNLYHEKDEVYGAYGAKVPHSFAKQSSIINIGLAQFFEESKNAFLLDLAGLVSLEGLNNAIDWRMNVNASMPFQLDFLALIAYDIGGIINNSEGKFAKCLILDLDNTTWGGIIGDDGMENIQVGDLGIGKAFKSLQLWAKALKQRGIILAICSKNEEVLAKEPFDKHPEMVLELSDISVFVANWNTKVENIRYIQQVLNIGLDSMVFLDDNPMERDIVRNHIPEIIVPELPEDPVEYLPYLRSLDLFSTLSYSSTDKDRTEQYQTEAKRVQYLSSFESMDTYLESLEMEAKISSFDDFYKPRIAQLTQRSNQFNPRTQRYSEEDIEKIMSKEDYYSRYLVLEDKFGNYGLISNIILKQENDVLFIENWVMSCRVLKRQIEELVINELVNLAKNIGLKKLRAEYIPTSKNILVKQLYSNLGFTEIADNEYELMVESYVQKDHQIKII